MRKLVKYKQGARYVIDEKLAIYPDSEIEEEVDLTDVSEEEFKQLKDNPHDENLIKKIKSRRNFTQ